MEDEIAKFLLAEWKWIITVLFGAIGAVVTATWLVSRFFYTQKLEVLKSENGLLEKQIADKDTHVRGVMEVMGERLLLATEEPKQLKALIAHREEEIESLRSENKGLMEQIDTYEEGDNKEILWQKLTVKTMRSSLRRNFYIHHQAFPKAQGVERLKIWFDRWDSSTSDADTNLSELTKYLSAYSVLATSNSLKLDIKYVKKIEELRFEKAATYQSMAKMLSPFFEGSSVMGHSSKTEKYRYTADRDVDYYLAVFGVPKQIGHATQDSKDQLDDEENEDKSKLESEEGCDQSR